MQPFFKLFLTKQKDNMKDLIQIAGVIDKEEAVKQAKARAKQQDAVLFSPACASFDMFANFEERGKCYQKIVAAL